MLKLETKLTLDRFEAFREAAVEELAARLATVEGIEKRGEDYFLTGPFYEHQMRIALRNSEIIQPEVIEESIARDGYRALHGLLVEERPRKEVVEEVKQSNLRGRGGAGFNTGRKWATAEEFDAAQKYIICNADEGDPGAYMDRHILETDPHAVLEGMAIAGYAIGASIGYIYVRAEYPLAVKRLKNAIAQATELGLLGRNILGSDFSFDIQIRLGAGAFVCGEGTALMASIEGRRGMPRVKVERTAHYGLFGMPTVINNVETLANVAQIVLRGAEWFRSIGTEDSAGTKVFALVGKVRNAGLVEVPMGMTLRQIVYDIGGGVREGSELKAVQTGGPSGGCIPVEYLDTPVDFISLKNIGSIMGSGGLVIMDKDDCMVDIARFFIEFSVDESCGKCTPCRIGNQRILEILDRIIAGEAEVKDLDYLEDLSHIICNTSLCGLGQASPNPVLSTLHYFRDEYLAHIEDHRCPAGVCSSLLHYEITFDCIGCGLCARKCPVNCISGKPREKFEINQEDCIKCGACFAACPVKAITKS